VKEAKRLASSLSRFFVEPAAGKDAPFWERCNAVVGRKDKSSVTIRWLC
jgi:hypothetical protein